jgi:4-amino-4-deoxy-L-arabinose transferase-like glycosyltransferase
MTFAQIWWLALGLKLALLPFLPITPDETYYFMWARHLALSYFDHPPFVAWIMTLAIPFWKTSFGIRLPGVIFSHLGFLPWFAILQHLKFSPRAIGIWTIGLLVGPLTGLGGFLITPDVPLVFFWSCSLLATLRMLENPSIKRWVVLGFSVGLGLLSKYVMVLFAPALLLVLIWKKKLHLLSKPGPWISVIIATVVFLPVIIWNMNHHFASFAFQARHGLASVGPSAPIQWNWPLEYFGAQFALLNPFVFIIGFLVAWKFPRENKTLIVFAFFPLIFFLLTSFRARVEANWPICAYPAFMALAARSVDVMRDHDMFRRVLKASYILCILFEAAVISHTIHPWLPINKDQDHTLITREWTDDVPLVKKYAPLFARSYQMASYLSYFRDPDAEVFKLRGLDREDVYDFLPQSLPLIPKNRKAFVVMNSHDVFPDAIDSLFSRKSILVLPSKMVLYELIAK